MEYAMTGDQIQQSIYEWLENKLPDGVNWQSADTLVLNLPSEVAMTLACDELEYNVSNGGWAQLLWNCSGQWRLLLDIAKRSYVIIGALPQAAAIDKIWVLCEENETECMLAQLAAGDTLNGFSDFTAKSYGIGPNWQELFYPDSPVYDQRLAWLELNESLVRKAIGLYEH